MSLPDMDNHQLKRGRLAEISPWSMVGGLPQHDLLHQLKAAYYEVLGKFCSEIDGCLKNFQTERTAWRKDLEYIRSLLKWDHATGFADTNWAQIGTQEHSTLGKGSMDLNNADVWYMTCTEFANLVKRRDLIRKCSVIRESWDPVSDEGKIESFLDNLTLMFGTSSVEVQDLDSNKKTTLLPCKKYVQTIRDSSKNKLPLSRSSPPLNLLNLKAAPIAGEDVFAKATSANPSRFNLLNAICYRAECTLVEETYHSPPSNAGKTKRRATILGQEIDLQSCLTFGLFAQRGSFSGWHVDVLNGTYVTCIAGIKVWPIVISPLSDAEKAAFAKEGMNWRPHPSRVRLILLRPGDTLYMPAGELVPHAPITITDCLMRGGMVWDTLRLPDILYNILYATENNDVTNESIPKQMVPALGELGDIIYSEASLIGVADDSLSDLFDHVTGRMKAKLSCNCGKLCRSNCYCRTNQASDGKCTAWCHQNVRNYDPLDCMY
jgi:hypothetical protein